MMRLFVSIEIPEDIKRKIQHFQDKLKVNFANAKWVKVSNLHITLKFLGEAAEERADDIISKLEEAVESFSPFEVSLAGIDVFPNARNPKVLFLKIASGFQTLSSLASDIDNKLGIIGFKKEEKPFRAHITLARFRSFKKTDASFAVKNEINGVFKFRVKKISLIQSTLIKNGPVYKCLKLISI